MDIFHQFMGFMDEVGDVGMVSTSRLESLPRRRC